MKLGLGELLIRPPTPLHDVASAESDIGTSRFLIAPKKSVAIGVTAEMAWSAVVSPQSRMTHSGPGAALLNYFEKWSLLTRCRGHSRGRLFPITAHHGYR